MNNYDLLKKYQEDHAPGFKVPPEGEEVYFIYRMNDGYYMGTNKDARTPTTVYFPREVAKKLVTDLRNGDIKLVA